MSKSPPFSISMLLFPVIIISAIIGGILGAIFGSSGFIGLIPAALCGFLPVPFGGVIRYNVAKMFASNSGVHANPPMAFSLPVRLLIGAVVAIAVAFAFTQLQIMSMGFGLGALIALITSMIASIIFMIKVSSS